ncbi:peptidoglycan DD-metalloendopeptidase family protein [Mariniluteicoccus flavus]
MAHATARRAAHAGPRRAASKVNTPAEETLSSLLKHALAAVSALGIGLVGSISLTAAAQSVRTSASTAQGASPDTTQAIPEAATRRAREAAVPPETAQQKPDSPELTGALEAFSRAAADGASRSAVRAEIDRAVASQKARERGASLTHGEQRQTAISGAALQDARSTELNNTKEAAKREQARLAEEKRKADEAMKAGLLPNPAAPPGGPQALPVPIPGGAGPALTGGTGGTAATPLPPGAYSVGARWGAVGVWARYHTGQDLPAPIGTSVRSAAPGIVTSGASGAGWAGIHVVVRHTDGSATLYAHLNGTSVRPGQVVQAGQHVGIVGMTGNTRGPHLHFEHYPVDARPGDVYSTDDPYAWLLRQGVRL